MNADEYQEQAARTLITDRAVPAFPLHGIRLAWNALGLAGEAGEVADLVKKAVFHEHGLDTDALVKELGDVLWYVAALCTSEGISLEYVMAQNIAKLQTRYPAGWDVAASQARVDVTAAAP